MYSLDSQSLFSLLTRDCEPSSFQEAREFENVDKWRRVVDKEMKTLHRNETWELVDIPPRRKVVGNKWVYKLNKKNYGVFEHYKYHLVEKGYMQKSGIGFNKIFSLDVKLTTVIVILALLATQDLKWSSWM